MMKKITLVSLLLLLGFSLVKAQSNKRKPGDLLQFSGVVVSGDSLQPVPFTAITVKVERLLWFLFVRSAGRRYHRILGFGFSEINLHFTR
jgi:hypothetical protein